MNYLAHAYFSYNNPKCLVGNMIADHVKGKLALEKYSEAIQKGIQLHRQIDAFTDTHPAISRAKILFRNDYRLYAGAIVDSLLDHFLANDPKYFPKTFFLEEFAKNTYQKLDEHLHLLPQSFLQYYAHMKAHNWLLNYRNLGGVQKSLKGLQQKANYMPDSLLAYQTFIMHYNTLQNCYLEFIGDLEAFTKSYISEINIQT